MRQQAIYMAWPGQALGYKIAWIDAQDRKRSL